MKKSSPSSPPTPNQKTAVLSAEAGESRSARRKRETRLSLMKAALELMSERSSGDVTIQQITAAADVGFGTFYNYFESKEDIYNCLLEEVFERSAKVVDEAVAHITDPAERLSVGLRYTLLQAKADPVWGRFLARSPFNPEIISQGLGKFLLRDVLEGIAKQRFEVKDTGVALMAVGSTVLGAVAITLQDPAPPNARLYDDLGLYADNLPERVCEMVLRILGVEGDEAARLASLPLPPLEGFFRLPV
ncbi:TetR/AcrR family transcriptional regulator [Pseudomonas sp. NCHU5208]|uniref:TetR/AcrR family transcriptional regulator n=1 Tax=unclassified Pseudomonas TaxID=196821 RepID=UPI003F96F788